MLKYKIGGKRKNWFVRLKFEEFYIVLKGFLPDSSKIKKFLTVLRNIVSDISQKSDG